MKSVITITTITFLLASSVQMKSIHKHSRQDFLQTLPEEDRADFVIYNLIRAIAYRTKTYEMTERLLLIFSDIDQAKVTKFQRMNPPIDFSMNLFDHVVQTFQVPIKGVMNLIISKEYCLGAVNLCLTPNDIASVCCPF